MIKAVIFDLDGTLYRGKTPVPGAAEALAALRARGKKTLFLTNAATTSRANVAQRLTGMGIEAGGREVYCGAYLLARYIAQHHKGKKVYAIGESGMVEEFRAAGIETSDDAGVVAVGLDRKLTYEKLCKAHLALGKGAVFLASSMDHIYPTEHGDLPGCGALVSAIEFAAGRKPYVVGKPNPYVLELIGKEQKLKGHEILVVGDRLDTDVAFAKNCGAASALVLTGAAKRSDINKVKPDYVLESVRDLTVLEL